MFLPPLEISNARKSSFSKTKSFPGRYASLARIGDFVRKIAQDAGFESFAVYSIEMAVDEACSNIIEHAYEGEGKGEIRCTCSVTEEEIRVVIKDTGKPFDPSSVPPPNLSKNIDDRQAHGLGLHFIRKWMDEVQFLSQGPENILTMLKRK
jgi:serine/threonine-protein kinase RsbW